MCNNIIGLFSGYLTPGSPDFSCFFAFLVFDFPSGGYDGAIITDRHAGSCQGGSTVKKLEMIIKPEKLDDLKTILESNHANGMMVTNIMGYGSQKGFKRIYRGNEYFVNLLPKLKVEVVVDDQYVEPIVEKVVAEISTGNIGDGKIFIYNIEDAVRVRTGERGLNAL